MSFIVTQEISTCFLYCHSKYILLRLLYGVIVLGRIGVSMKTAIYARVSSDKQTEENQLIALRDYSKARGWEIVQEFIDHGISGTKDSRPGLDELMQFARKRKFDVVLVSRFDRFARSSKHLIIALEEFRALKIQFVSLNEGIDTTGPLGQFIFTVIAAFSQLEREILIERTKAGLDRARKQGKRLGPPIKVTNPERIRELRKNMSVRQIAQEMNLSVMTIYNYLRGSVV
jgi:DNA invertase Pin-like site-specific DNA recombinase